MRKFIVLLVLFALIFMSCVQEEEKEYGQGIRYDHFRGDTSAIINLCQYETLNRCIDQFDLNKYKDKEISYYIYSPNEYVHNQASVILNMRFIDNNINLFINEEHKSEESQTQETEKDKNEKGNQEGEEKKEEIKAEPDYIIEFNLITGGYHFYQGFVFNVYKSITRIVLIEKDASTDKATYYDSGYQTYRHFNWHFISIFKIFIYIWISIFVLMIVFRKRIKLKLHSEN